MDNIQKLHQTMQSADAVVIGAGAGLSTSAGFTYSGERFERHFADFIGKYGFTDMYSAGFYPFPTEEEHWAYWSRHIYYNRYVPAPKPIYDNLLKLLKDKDYFVITTNVDHQFQKAGFDKQRLFYTQGDYGLFQCAKPCHQKNYDNEETVRKMIAAQVETRHGTSLQENNCRYGRATSPVSAWTPSSTPPMRRCWVVSIRCTGASTTPSNRRQVCNCVRNVTG